MGWIGFGPHGSGFTYHMCVGEVAARWTQSGLQLLVMEPGLGVGCCAMLWLAPYLGP